MPQAFASLAANLGRAYLQACQADGIEPDAQLLQPVIEVLERLQQENEAG